MNEIGRMYAKLVNEKEITENWVQLKLDCDNNTVSKMD
jgi:hypothetical protein